MSWCDKINAVLGTNFSVRIADAYVMSDADDDEIPDSIDYVDDEPTKEPEEL